MTQVSDLEQNIADGTKNPAARSATVPASQPAQSYREWLVLAALAIAMLAQLWTSVVQLSITSDEGDHLHAAYRYWQCNDFGWNPEHPPLVKLVAGLPLQFMKINDPLPHACGAQNSKVIDFLAGHQFVFANPERMLTAARFAVSSFAVLLLVTVWFFARRLFGPPVAVVSGVLVAFDPYFLANGALVTTDVAAAVSFLLVAYAVYCYATEPNFTRLLAISFATGLAVCVKHSAILLAAILPLLLLSDAIFFRREGRGSRLLRYAGALVVVAAVALTMLWACYGFRYSARPGGAAVWSPPRLPVAHGAVATKVIPVLEHWHLLPEAYLVGLQDVVVGAEVGERSFLLGKLYHTGNWFYFPVAAAIKYTLPVLFMVVVSLLSWGFWRRHSRQLLFVIVPALVYLTFSMNSKLNIGSRHLLPVLPFVTVFAAAGAWNTARRSKWAAIPLAALLAFHAISSLHAYPNYLSYSNELWGGQAETYRYLTYSDADWGQAQKMVRAYVEKTRPANCFFLRTNTNLNADYGIRCAGISEIQWDPLQTPYTGTMIVSSTVLDGVSLRGVSVQTRRVFKDLKPTAKLGGSALLVYEGTFDVSPIVAVQLAFKARKEGEDDPQLALSDAEKAAALDPLNGDAHVVMCSSYQALGQLDKAEQECNTGLELVRKDPQYGPEQVKYLEDFITRKGLKIYNHSEPMPQ